MTKWDGLGTSNALHPPILAEESNFGTYLRFAYVTTCRLARPLSEATKLSPSLRGLLHPGFRRIGHPHPRRISLLWQVGKFHWRDLHPQEDQLASLQPIGRLSVTNPATSWTPFLRAPIPCRLQSARLRRQTPVHIRIRLRRDERKRHGIATATDRSLHVC